MNNIRHNSVYSLRALMMGAMLCVWLLTQGLAAAHSHDGVQLHGDCAMCQVAQIDSLPETSYPSKVAWPTRDLNSEVFPASHVAAVRTRYFSPRAPPAFS